MMFDEGRGVSTGYTPDLSKFSPRITRDERLANWRDQRRLNELRASAPSGGKRLPFPYLQQFSRRGITINSPTVMFYFWVSFGCFAIFAILVAFVLAPEFAVLLLHGLAVSVLCLLRAVKCSKSQGVMAIGSLDQIPALVISGDSKRPAYRIWTFGVLASGFMVLGFIGLMARSATFALFWIALGLVYLLITVIRVRGGYTDTGYWLTPESLRYRVMGVEWSVNWGDITDVSLGKYEEGPQITTSGEAIREWYFKRHRGKVDRKQHETIEFPTSETCLRPGEMVTIVKHFVESPADRAILGSVESLHKAQHIIAWQRARAAHGAKPHVRRH